MKYFITDAERFPGGATDYHEFSRAYSRRLTGRVCWAPDSIYLHDERIEGTRFVEMMLAAVPKYDYYGATSINKKQWEAICGKAREFGGKEWEIIQEAIPWAREVFRKKKTFYIIGI